MLDAYGELALNILKQAKKDYREGVGADGNGLYAAALERYVNLRCDAVEVAEYVAAYCLGMRLKCKACEGEGVSLHTNIIVDNKLLSTPLRTWNGVIPQTALLRLYKCKRCGEVSCIPVVGQE